MWTYVFNSKFNFEKYYKQTFSFTDVPKKGGGAQVVGKTGLS
jgi:hypothetical protein